MAGATYFERFVSVESKTARSLESKSRYGTMGNFMIEEKWSMMSVHKMGRGWRTWKIEVVEVVSAISVIIAAHVSAGSQEMTCIAVSLSRCEAIKCKLTP